MAQPLRGHRRAAPSRQSRCLTRAGRPCHEGGLAHYDLGGREDFHKRAKCDIFFSSIGHPGSCAQTAADTTTKQGAAGAVNVYTPIFVLGALAFGFAAFSVVIATFTGPRRYNRAKYDAYECGIEPTPQPIGGGRFPVKYYLTAMMFIIFDIELVFLYPWAVSFDALGAFGLVAMMLFLLNLAVPYVYEWRRGGLEWD